MRDKAQQQAEGIGDQAPRLKARLGAYSQAVQNILMKVDECLAEIHRQAASTLDTTQLHDSSQQAFSQLETALEQCAVLAGEILGTEFPATDIARDLDHLKSGYTMESERSLHAAVVAESLRDNGHPTRLTSLQVPAINENPLTALATAETAPSKPANTTVPAEPGSLANPEVAPEKKPEYGDNVELF